MLMQGDKKVMGRRLGQGRMLEARRKDGTTFPALITLSEARVEGGRRRQFTAAMRDLSQLMNVVTELNTHRCVWTAASAVYGRMLRLSCPAVRTTSGCVSRAIS